MEQFNKIVMQERLTLQKALEHEKELTKSHKYSIYHSQNVDYYDGAITTINEIVKFHGRNEEDFILHMGTTHFTEAQQRDIILLRNTPRYKRFLGKTALQDREEIEKALGKEIHNVGGTFPLRNKMKRAIKIPEELNEDARELNERIHSLLEKGTIPQWKAEKYLEKLYYIYNYYMSMALGEQIPLRKISDAEYAHLEKLAAKNKISLKEQLEIENQNIRYDFEDIQRQEEDDYYNRKKANTK